MCSSDLTKGLGNVSDNEREVIRKSVKPLDGRGVVTESERKVIRNATPTRYPSGLTDADIDKVLSSKQFQEGASHFSDYKRGGKTRK